MQGAVLHGLVQELPDWDPVEQRVMRRNYGTQLAPLFDPDKHPYYRRFIDETDGHARCKVLNWYAKKVGNPRRWALRSRAKTWR
jgi:hypothetical protein